MKVFNLFRGQYGYNYRMMRIQEIGDHPEKAVIEKRLRAIEFSKLYGINAALDAYQVSRSTLFAWKQKLRKHDGVVTDLAPGSRAPKKRRQRIVNPLIERSIIDYRTLHPGVGKEAVKPAVDRFCKTRRLKTISESTVGRIIKDLKKQGKLFNGQQKLRMIARTGRLAVRQKRSEKKLRRKGYMPQNAGDLVQIDSITFFLDNIKRYVISAVDLVTGFAFAYGYKKLNSANAKDFFHKFLHVAPFPVKHIQTDNGDEFEKNFRMDIRASPIIHFHNYPRHPQSNGHIERFNRTIEEQHIQWHEDELLSDDLVEFNHNLMEYLIWFNTEKPHRSLNKKPPLRYYIDSLHANNKKSNMLWTLTQP
jgi:putative transposase